MNTSLVVVCYNALSHCKKAVDSVISHASKEAQIILVDNHSFDTRTREYIYVLRDPRLRVVDPGRNIGCHNGFNFGFRMATGSVFFKIDDDTCVETSNFDRIIADFLMQEKAYAFCAANIYNIVPISPSSPRFSNNGHQFAMVDNVNFSVVAWTRRTFSLLGPLCPPPSLARSASLYGDEDGHYNSQATSRSLRKAVCLDVKVCHQDTKDRVLLTIWKWWYGYKKRTSLSFEAFRVNQIELQRAAEVIGPSPQDPTFKAFVQMVHGGKIR